MKKHKLYVQLEVWNSSSSGLYDEVIISNRKRESGDIFTYVDIGETECEFEFDATDLNSKINAEKIRNLEQYKEKFMAETQVKLNNLDEQIAKLKCLDVK